MCSNLAHVLPGISALLTGRVPVPERRLMNAELAALVSWMAMHLGELVCQAVLRLVECPVLSMLLSLGRLSRPPPGGAGRRMAGVSGSSVGLSPLPPPDDVPSENTHVALPRTRSGML